jgi:predicted ATPase/DNA-binding SARP family transcriptional activator
MVTSSMRFGVLGAVELYDERGERVSLGGPRQVSLLAFLLMHANRAVSYDELLEAVWLGQPVTGSVKRLQVAVARLRRTLDGLAAGERRLRSAAAGYVLSVDDGDVDAAIFAAGVDEGRQALAAGDPQRAREVLRTALGLWRGPAFADVAYEDFAQSEIRRLQELRLSAHEVRVDADLELCQHAAVVPELEGLLAEHPTRERFVGQLMLALYRCGRQADALDVYQHARMHLATELGLQPGPAIRQLQTAILEHSAVLEPDRAEARTAAVMDRLPRPATATIGRDAELQAVADQLRSDAVRLLTLVGPGGVGKTRLAIEAARMARADFTDGGAFVELAGISEHHEVASAIARAIGATPRMGEQAQATLLRVLRGRQLLLVVDNFEHVVDAAPVLAELVSACLQLTILVTSREPTRLAAERVFPLGPLTLPGDASALAADAERFGAIAMFCDRARARDAHFVLDDANAHSVAEICRRLDGLPLALELAAARIGSLDPAELAERLDQALVVLVSGARDAPERQRTLRATIDWSYGLLSAAERAAFARMAVFANGATMATAEDIAGATMDTLDGLVAKQMLVRRGQRLLMLQTVREYALERLDADGAADETYRRLAAWSVRLARQATPHFVRIDRSEWLTKLDAEYPNAVSALSWALDRGQAAVALELVGELREYWLRSGRWADGRRWAEAALDVPGRTPPLLRAKALLCRAITAGGRRPEYRRDLEASLALFRASDDVGNVALCLGHLAAAEAFAGHYDAAAALAERAVEAATEAGDEDALGFVLAQGVLTSPHYEQAAVHATAAIPVLERAGDLRQLGMVCNLAGYAAIVNGRYRDALDWLDRGVDAARALGDLNLTYLLRGNQGVANLFLDRSADAGEGFREALAVCRASGSEDIVEEALFGLGAATAVEGDLELAGQLVGAARAHPAPGMTPGEAAVWSRLEDAFVAPARERFGPRDWDRAERAGAMLTVAQAIDLALSREPSASSMRATRR